MRLERLESHPIVPVVVLHVVEVAHQVLRRGVHDRDRHPEHRGRDGEVQEQGHEVELAHLAALLQAYTEDVVVPLKLVKLAVAPLLVHDLGSERGPHPGGVPNGTAAAHVVRVERLTRVRVAVLDAHLHVKPGDSEERRSKGRDVLGVEVRAGHRQEILELDPDLLPPRVRLEHGVGTEARDVERGVRDLGSPRGDDRVVEPQHHLVDARDEVVLGGQARGGSRRGI